MTDLDLAAAVDAVLASQWGEDYLGKHAAHAHHSYHASCAVCSGDVAAILAVAAPILLAEVAGLQRVIDDQEERLLAQAAVIGEMQDTAANRFVEELTNQTKLRSIDFRNGMHMDLEPAREIVAAFVACARTMLGDAPNYTETKVEMDVKVAESPETFTFVVQRREPGCLTPHEARVAAEGKVAQLQARLEEASAVIVLAGQQVSLDSHAWVTLDGYDGSGDACRELEAKGYTRSGNGGWYPPAEDGA